MMWIRLFVLASSVLFSSQAIDCLVSVRKIFCYKHFRKTQPDCLTAARQFESRPPRTICLKETSKCVVVWFECQFVTAPLLSQMEH